MVSLFKLYLFYGFNFGKISYFLELFIILNMWLYFYDWFFYFCVIFMNILMFYKRRYGILEIVFKINYIDDFINKINNIFYYKINNKMGFYS